MHHLDSWIKIDQLDVTRFIISPFTAQHVSNVSTSIFRSLRLTVDLFHVLYFSVRIEVLALAFLFTEQYNTWNKSTISRKLLKMDVLTFETCWAVQSQIKKRVTSSWSIFIHLHFISAASKRQLSSLLKTNTAFHYFHSYTVQENKIQSQTANYLH